MGLGEQAYFDIQINEEVLCTTLTDKQQTVGDERNAACSAAIYATEGWYRSVFN